MSPTAPDLTDRPRIWACGISRLSDLFLDIAAEYNDRAELRVITRGFEDIVREIDAAGAERPDVVVAVGRDPDRRVWYDRDSRADRYCFSFWRFTILLLAG